MALISEKKLEKSSWELEFEISNDLIKKEFAKVSNQYMMKNSVDGFRKGKAPLSLIQSRFKNEIRNDVTQNLIRTDYFNALDQKKYRPISDPHLDFKDVDYDADFKFKAIFEVFPTIELSDYKSLEADERAVTIVEEDILNELEILRNNNAELSKKNEGEAAVKGDFVKIKFKKISTDFDPETVQFEEMSLIAGNRTEDFNFDIHVIGMKVNEEKKVTFKYPENFTITDLAGKEVEYLIHVVEISNRKLPDLDDNFAKDLGEYENLNELKEKIKKDIQGYTESKCRGEAKSLLLKKIIDSSSYDIPQSYILREKFEIYGRLQDRLGIQVKNLEELAKYFGMDPKELSEKMDSEATDSIKMTLTLSEIVNKENITVPEEKYEEAIETVATKRNMDKAEMKKVIETNNMADSIKSQIMFDMALDFIYSNSKINKLSPISLKDFMDKKND